MKYFVVLAVVLAACGHSSPQTDSDATPAADASSSDAAPDDASVDAPPDAPPADDGGPIGRLQAAEGAGTIDHPTFLLYALYASLAPSKLPTEYGLRDNEDLPEGTEYAIEAQTNLATYSADIQAKLAPLLARPTDDASIFNQQPLIAHPSANLHGWETIVDDTNHVVYWYNDTRLHDFVQAEVNDVASRQVFAHYDAIMGVPHCGDGTPKDAANALNEPYESYTDVYFTVTGDVVANRVSRHNVGLADNDDLNRTGLASKCQAPYVTFVVTIPTHPGPQPSDPPVAILPVTDEMWRYAIEHELFHVAQMSRSWQQDQVRWLLESTASWATSRLTSPADTYISADSDEKRGPWVQGMPLGPFDYHAGRGWYQTALFWTFAINQKGAAETIVGDIFAQLEGATDSLPVAASHVPAFEDTLSEFILDLWNTDPVGKKLLHSGMPYSLTQTDVVPATIADQQTLDIATDDLPASSGKYAKVTVMPSVKQLVIDLAPMGPHMRARGFKIYNNDTTHPIELDWTGGQQTFCRDLPAQNITSIFFAISNVDTTHATPTPGAKIHLEAKDACGGSGSANGQLTYTSSILVNIDPIAPGAETGAGGANYTYSLQSQLTVTPSSVLNSSQYNMYLYNVTGTNMISSSGTGQFDMTWKTQGTTTMTDIANESSSASGSCSTPSAGSDPLFGLGPQPKGSLYVKVYPTGAASFEFDYDVRGVSQTFSFQHHLTEKCPDMSAEPNYTKAEMFQMGVGVAIQEVQCDGTSSMDMDDTGATPRVAWPHTSQIHSIFDGSFDPDTGDVSVMTGGATQGCGNMTYPGNADLAGASHDLKTCSESEMASMSIHLGALARPN